MLVLCLVTFIVLAGGVAWGAEQPSQTTQPGTLHSTMISGKVAEPVAGATPPVETPPVETSPVQTPLPPTKETPPVEETSPLPPTNETPPAKEPSPPPVDPVPSTPEPEPAPRWFAMEITDGQIVESDPMFTSWSVSDFGQVLEPEPMPNDSPDVTDPALDPAAGADVDGYASEPAPDVGPAVPDWEDAAPPVEPVPGAVLPVLGPATATEHAPPATGLAGLVGGFVPEPAAPRGDVGPLPQPALLEELKEAPATAPATALATALATSLLGTGPVDSGPVPKRAPANVAKPSTPGLTPSAVPAPIVPAASVGGALRLPPSSLGTTAAASAVGSAVETVGSAAASVGSAAASVAAEVLGSLAGDSPDPPSTHGSQEQPSEGTPQQPAPPLSLPVGGGGSFSPLTGSGGQLGTGGGFAPLLLGILALLVAILLRRDFRTYLVSCDLPKPSSALLGPLERPG
jgi:hypothetical protein